MKLRELKTGKSSLSGDYGQPDRQYGGIIMDVTALPDGTYFHVENGGWWGYITSDSEGNRVMYTGVNMGAKDPTENCVRRVVFNEGESYDTAVGKLKIQGYVEEVRKVRKVFDFEPEAATVEDLQRAFEKLSVQENQMNLFKKDIFCIIDRLANGEEIDATALKNDIEDAYEFTIGGRKDE